MSDKKPLLLSGRTRTALKHFGSRVSAARKQHRMSQAELGERLGVSRYTVMALERGDPKVTAGTLFEAAAIVGFPVLVEDSLAIGDSSLFQPPLPQRVRKKTQQVNDDF